MEGKITFITGGCRSGKSRYALELAEKFRKKAFIATARPFDEEMLARIQAHQMERKDAFFTLESPYDLAGALGDIPERTDVAVIDCLTVWLGNLFYKHGKDVEHTGEIDGFYKALTHPPCNLIIVSNETGLGIVPMDPESRHFRDLSGKVNQEVAQRADKVFVVFSGLPLCLKG
jgi:adenosylcobinamide kinase/adenosylcobinamide-phosphate guanylyltransferase